MDNEIESTGYLGKVQHYFKAHPSAALGLAIFVILAISFSGFLELLKIVFSPQIVICGLVLYFLVTFKAEVARLIDRIKEASAWGASIKTHVPPEDKKNIPEPEMKISKSRTDTQFHVGVADSGAPELPKWDVIKVHRQATYWFFRYLSTELPSVDKWALREIQERWSGQIGLEHFYEMLEARFLSSSRESSTVLRTLKDYGLIDYASGNVSITDLGASFLGFLDEQVVALKRAAAAMQKEIRAKNEAAEE